MDKATKIALGLGTAGTLSAVAMAISDYHNNFVALGFGVAALCGYGYAGWHYLYDGGSSGTEKVSVRKLSPFSSGAMPLAKTGPVDKEAARATWGQFRAYGVELRNLASMQTFSPGAWDDWQEAVVEWNAKVVASIRTVSEADAHWFATLDSVPPPRIQPTAQWMNQAQLLLYRMHDFRLVKLTDLIEQYRPKGPAVWG